MISNHLRLKLVLDIGFKNKSQLPVPIATEIPKTFKAPWPANPMTTVTVAAAKAANIEPSAESQFNL